MTEGLGGGAFPQFKVLRCPLPHLQLCVGRTQGGERERDAEPASVPPGPLPQITPPPPQLSTFNFPLILGLRLRSESPSKCFRETVIVLR